MNFCKGCLPKTVWLGTIGLAAMLLGSAPSCKAQEVSPAIFTATGVEDVYPAKKPLSKNTAKVQTSTHPRPTIFNQAVDRRRTQRAARKQNVAASPSL